MLFLFEEGVYLKCMLLERNVVFELDGSTFSHYGGRGGTSKTSSSITIKCNLLKLRDQ